jgi:nucleotide-binding universal stress UspA family protein
MYLWVSAYRVNLENELGWSIRPEIAAENLATHENPASDLSETGSWRAAKMFARYTDRLFADILVPLTGADDNWSGLEQAILVAKKEDSTIYGLHIIPSNRKEDESEIQAIQTRFQLHCQETNLPGSLMVEKGNISRQVTERALLTDLVVLNVAHPPQPGLSNLRSGLRSIIWHTARPILTVQSTVSPMDNALLAFDGSAKSKEALFVAAYLAEKWHTRLTVLTIANENSHSVQEYAQSYLELHEIKADYRLKSGSFNIFLNTIQECQINLVVIGSYSGTAIKQVISDSAVNFLLRKANCSLLICH